MNKTKTAIASLALVALLLTSCETRINNPHVVSTVALTAMGREIHPGFQQLYFSRRAGYFGKRSIDSYRPDFGWSGLAAAVRQPAISSVLGLRRPADNASKATFNQP